MFEKLGLTRISQSLAAYSGARLGVIAANVANADTPGYRARDLRDFGSVHAAHHAFDLRTSRPGHLTEGQRAGAGRQAFMTVPSGGAMAPNGNDVSLDLQMMKMTEARQSHDMALAVYRATSAITRTALGRTS